MSPKSSPGCLACAARAPELGEDASGHRIYSIDLGWRIAVRLDWDGGAWFPVSQCYVIDADGNLVPRAVPNPGEIERLHKAVEVVK